MSVVEVMRRLVLRHCSLVKKGRQSYSTVLHDVLAMTSHHAFKELVSKNAAPYHSKLSSTVRQEQKSQRIEARKGSSQYYLIN